MFRNTFEHHFRRQWSKEKILAELSDRYSNQIEQVMGPVNRTVKSAWKFWIIAWKI